MDVTKFLPGINVKLWLIKIGIGLAILSGTAYIAYEKGQASERVTIAEAAKVEAEIRTINLIETVVKRVEVVHTVEKENIRYIHKLDESARNMDEAIADAAPMCSLTTDEWLQVNAFTDAINSSFDLPSDSVR